VFKDNDTTKTANIKIDVLQAWHIFTRTRTIAMLYLKYKFVLTCDSFHYLMTINLETFQRISVTKVTHADNFNFKENISIVRVLVKMCQACNTTIFIFAIFVV